MNILHITVHMGGGLGTVIGSWVKKDRVNHHRIVCLDYVNEKAIRELIEFLLLNQDTRKCIPEADIVVCHFYDHPMLYDFLSKPLPRCRLVFWAHKNFLISEKYLTYPDLFLDTSPIQGHGRHIWSTGDISRFLEIKPKAHEGFNIGTVASPKMHPRFFEMCEEINRRVPKARFTILGENKFVCNKHTYKNVGKIDDVSPYLAEMDCFFYPLRKNHFGTAEQVLGETLSAGIVPVTMDNAAERLIINHGENGMRAINEMEAIQYVKMLYDKPHFREILSKNARNTASKIYNIDTMIKQWDEVFEEMMKEPKKGREGI